MRHTSEKNVRLTPELESFVQAQVTNGGYESVGQVIQTAVAIMRQREIDNGRELCTFLAAVDGSVAALERGEGVEGEPFVQGILSKLDDLETARREEMRKILELAKPDRELETFILLHRHLGLRISDASFLRREQIIGSTIKVVTIKTRSAATIPIPAWLEERLLEVKDKQEGGYLFAVGSLKLPKVTNCWRIKIHRIFKQLGIKG